jgi:cell division protein FtsQ
MSRIGTRRSSILTRRSRKGERLIEFARASGLRFGVIVALAWLGAWLHLSGGGARLGNWAEHAMTDIAAASGFRLENLIVKGRENTDADAIKAVINMDKGDPLFAFNPEQAQAMLAKLSWVRSVRVERRWPDTIFIEIEERVPLALWQRNKRLSLIDREGAVLTEHRLERFKDLMIVTGQDAEKKAHALLSLLQAEPAIMERAEGAVLISSRRWDLKLEGGKTVNLPEEEVGLALRRLALRHEEDGLMDKAVSVIDLRMQGSITVSVPPGTALEHKAGYSDGARKDGAI